MGNKKNSRSGDFMKGALFGCAASVVICAVNYVFGQPLNPDWFDLIIVSTLAWLSATGK